MATDRWYTEDPAQSLPRRIERVLGIVQARTATPCGGCGDALCGHAVVFSIVAGHEARPLCLGCLAREHERDEEAMRDEMALFVHSKPCLSQGWRLASLREGFAPDAPPACAWPESAGSEAGSGASAPEAATEEPTACDDHFDAGDQGCGELVLALRIRLAKLPPGGLLRLTALDPGAPEDIPAWCRLTGNPLVHAAHPDYFIRRKEDR